MRAIVVAGSVALTLAAVATIAVAQDPAAAPTGNYGGGAVVAPPRSIYHAGNMLIRRSGRTIERLRVGHGALGGGDMSMAANAWRRAGRRHAAGPAPTLY